MNNFLLDESVFENLGSLAKADVMLTSPGGSYEVETFNDVLYLTLQPGKSNNTKFDEEASLNNKDKNLLLSLISVIKEPAQWDWSAISKYFRMEKVKRWCKNNGLPAVDYDIRRIAIRLDVFCLKTATLYLAYRLWQVIKNEDIDGINKYSAILFDHPALDKSRPWYEKRKRMFYIQSNVEHRKYHATCLFQPILNNQLKNLDLKISIEGYSLYLEAESIFDLCFFHLANMIAKGEKEGKNIKECKGCGDLYTGHGNSQFCKYCNRKTVWSRENPRPKNKC